MKSAIDKWGDERERAGRKEGRKEGKKEGKEEQAKSTALAMAKDNMDIAKIARYVKKKASTIRKWIEEEQAQAVQVK